MSEIKSVAPEVIAKNLESLRIDIAKAKNELAETKGQLKAKMDELYKQFKVKTLDDAEKLLNQFETDLKKIKKEIDIKYHDLYHGFDWDGKTDD